MIGRVDDLSGWRIEGEALHFGIHTHRSTESQSVALRQPFRFGRRAREKAIGRKWKVDSWP